MNRRSVLASAGLAASSLAGCFGQLEDDDEAESREEIRRIACSHAPAEAEQATHDVTTEGYHFLRERYTPVVLVTARERIESIIDSDQREHIDVDTLFEGVNFDEQAVLIWEASERITTDHMEFLGVTRPDNETIRAYGCQYRLGSGGQEETYASFIVTVDARETPRRAELLVQDEDEEIRTLTAER